MGGGCPFVAGKVVLPLCLALFRDREWRARAAEAGLLVGAAMPEEGMDRKMGTCVYWSSFKGKDIQFSIWLGLVSSTLPFTNAALLFLWFYEIVSTST